MVARAPRDAADLGAGPLSKPASRISGVLRAVLAVALLALVAFHVPWHDSLSRTQGGAALDVPGAIQGEWRAAAVEFLFAPDAVIPANWPDEARAAQTAGRPLAVARVPGGEGVEGAWDWRPGLLHVFREMEAQGLVIAVLLLVFSACIAVTRWWRLLRIAGCPARWYDALRLTFIGMFMNLVLPGLTGGDLVKAVLIVRENPARRADALMSVIVDRGLGLLVLMALAAAVVLLAGEQFAELRWSVLLVFGGVLFAVWAVLHPWPRRLLRLERVLARLPQKERLRSLDRALRLYSRHPGEMAIATVLSVLNHASIATALWVLGHAFGDTLGWPEYLGVAAIANTISSIPIAPGGWGVGEALYGYLFHLLGAPTALGIAVSVTYRLLNTALGIAGGVFLLLPGGRAARAEIEAESAEIA